MNEPLLNQLVGRCHRWMKVSRPRREARQAAMRLFRLWPRPELRAALVTHA